VLEKVGRETTEQKMRLRESPAEVLLVIPQLFPPPPIGPPVLSQPSGRTNDPDRIESRRRVVRQAGTYFRNPFTTLTNC